MVGSHVYGNTVHLLESAVFPNTSTSRPTRWVPSWCWICTERRADHFGDIYSDVNDVAAHGEAGKESSSASKSEWVSMSHETTVWVAVC